MGEDLKKGKEDCLYCNSEGECMTNCHGEHFPLCDDVNEKDCDIEMSREDLDEIKKRRYKI